VREVARVNVEALVVTGLTKARPGDSCLELEVVEGDVQHGADFIAFTEMCNNELGVLNALFHFKVEDFHSTRV
jgi:hypothetical protein